MKLSDLLSRYQETIKQLDKIAENQIFPQHRKHLCKTLNEYPPHVQEKVSTILRVQLDLMVKIYRLDPNRFKNTNERKETPDQG